MTHPNDGSARAAIARCLTGALLLAAGAGIGALPAGAEPASAWVEGYNSKARLIAGTDVGSSRLYAGVHVELAPGWKTYWRHPGDSGGVPPYFDWSGSTNLESARVLYPAPARLKDATGDAIGYKDSVVFPVVLTAADRSKSIELKLTMEYGICREICVPAEARITLMVPADGAAVAADLATAIAKVPREVAARQPGDPQVREAKAVLTGDKPTLVIEVSFPSGAAGADLYVEAPDGIFVPLPKRTAKAGGTDVVFEVDLSNGVEPQDLKGKRLLITMVSDKAQAEASWTVD